MTHRQNTQQYKSNNTNGCCETDENEFFVDGGDSNEHYNFNIDSESVQPFNDVEQHINDTHNSHDNYNEDDDGGSCGTLSNNGDDCSILDADVGIGGDWSESEHSDSENSMSDEEEHISDTADDEGGSDGMSDAEEFLDSYTDFKRAQAQRAAPLPGDIGKGLFYWSENQAEAESIIREYEHLVDKKHRALDVYAESCIQEPNALKRHQGLTQIALYTAYCARSTISNVEMDGIHRIYFREHSPGADTKLLHAL